MPQSPTQGVQVLAVPSSMTALVPSFLTGMGLVRIVLGIALATGWLLMSIVYPLSGWLRGAHEPKVEITREMLEALRACSSPPGPPSSLDSTNGTELSANTVEMSFSRRISRHIHFLEPSTPVATQRARTQSLSSSRLPKKPMLRKRSQDFLAVKPFFSAMASDSNLTRWSNASAETIPPSSPESEYAPELPEAVGVPRKGHRLLRMASQPFCEMKQKPALRKQKSIPNVKTLPKATPPPLPSVKRTDPYSEPYYFPTPAAPDAHKYVHLVKLGRKNISASVSLIDLRRVSDPEKPSRPAQEKGQKSLSDLVVDPPRQELEKTKHKLRRQWSQLLPRSRHLRSVSAGSDPK